MFYTSLHQTILSVSTHASTSKDPWYVLPQEFYENDLFDRNSVQNTVYLFIFIIIIIIVSV